MGNSRRNGINRGKFISNSTKKQLDQIVPKIFPIDLVVLDTAFGQEIAKFLYNVKTEEEDGIIIENLSDRKLLLNPTNMIVNNNQKYGAANILNHKVLDKGAEIIGGNIKIFILSTNRLLIFPLDYEKTDEVISNAVKLESQTDPDCIRTNNLYLYDKNTKKLSIVK